MVSEPEGPSKVKVSPGDTSGVLDVAITVPGCSILAGYILAFDVVFCKADDTNDCLGEGN